MPSWVESWAFGIPLLVAALAWLLNEVSKRKWERHRGKEASYRELLRTVRGFYRSTLDSDLQREFLNQVNFCWLYSPDRVIRAAYTFLDKVEGKPVSEKTLEQLAGDLFAAARKDLMRSRLWRRTKLSGDDFRHFAPTATA